MARTAVVAGTATAVSNRVSRRQANRWAAQEQAAYPQQQPAGYEQPGYPPPQPAYAPPPPAPNTEDKLAQLKQLGELKESGVLTDAEFEAQKAQILAS
jgi:hypothetical protein